MHFWLLLLPDKSDKERFFELSHICQSMDGLLYIFCLWRFFLHMRTISACSGRSSVGQSVWFGTRRPRVRVPPPRPSIYIIHRMIRKILLSGVHRLFSGILRPFPHFLCALFVLQQQSRSCCLHSHRQQLFLVQILLGSVAHRLQKW